MVIAKRTCVLFIYWAHGVYSLSLQSHCCAVLQSTSIHWQDIICLLDNFQNALSSNKGAHRRARDQVVVPSHIILLSFHISGLISWQTIPWCSILILFLHSLHIVSMSQMKTYNLPSNQNVSSFSRTDAPLKAWGGCFIVPQKDRDSRNPERILDWPSTGNIYTDDSS